MSTFTIGISPEYNYPGNIDIWNTDNTFYASNFGGSLVTRAIMREFNADYISDFSDIESIKKKYDTCILSLATHAHKTRNISKYVDLLEKLQVKVIVLSLGVEDYVGSLNEPYKLSPSVRRLLHLAQESSSWIGVRGPYTASIVQQNGFRDVVPIGCPTIYWNMKEEFDLNVPDKASSNPLVVYHKSLVIKFNELIKNYKILGQDFQDEVIFTENLLDDKKLLNEEMEFYNSLENSEETLSLIKKNGLYPKTVDEWFNIIGKQDMVFGPRLHGCIASLIQGVPAIFTPRDLRVREMVEVFNFPSVDYKKLTGLTFEDMYKMVDFDKFKETYKFRFKNYMAFLNENKIDSNFEKYPSEKFTYATSDITSSNYLSNIQISEIKNELKHYNQLIHSLKGVKQKVKRIFK